MTQEVLLTNSYKLLIKLTIVLIVAVTEVEAQQAII